MKMKISILLCLLLSACGPSTPTWVAPTQTWNGFHVHFETRPDVLSAGMNEFLIFVNLKGKVHIPDLLVQIRINNQEVQQAIPDGELGIYRRALYIQDIHKDFLHVHLTYQGKQGHLIFPLAPDVPKNITH